MTFHNLPMTGSGVTDCAGGCGEHVMTSDLSKPAYCGSDGSCENEPYAENDSSAYDDFVFRNSTI